jgi:phosphonate transport system permease protein
MATAPSRAAPSRIYPPWTRQRVGLTALAAIAVVLLVLSWHEIGMGVLPLFTGVGNIFRFTRKTVPPQFYGFGHTIDLALITACMAVVGTALAAILAIPVGFMAARNTTVHPTVRWVARSIIVVCRSVPDLVFAIVFVEAIGIGVLPGVLALGFHSVGMLGKLFAESIEQVPTEPREAVTATGAGRMQNVATSVVPQVLPSFSSITLYRLDINLRSSVILGWVGAGGIGFELNQYMDTLQFQESVGIVLVIFALIVIVEVISATIRRSLIGSDAPVTSAAAGLPRRPSMGDRIVRVIGRSANGEDMPAFDRQRVRPPWTRERVQRLCFSCGAVVVVVVSLWVAKINPLQAITSLRQIWDTVKLYFPPNFTTDRADLITGTLQSASVAMVATTIGFLLAVPIGLLAARNVADKWIYRAARGFLVVVRAVPELILAIIFVVAVGLGLVAGAFALIVGTVGFMSKLVADSIEEVPPMPREAVLSAGATRLQETATSVVLPATPTLVGSGLYMLDVNFRSSTVLGLVGAGGIGFILFQSVEILAYRTTGAVIVSTFAVVLVIEIVTNWVRKHLI